MKVAITGSLGQLGGELCRQIRPQAVPLDIDTLDLTDGPAVSKRFLALAPDLVINCAAYTQVDKAESEPEKSRAVNVTAVRHLAGVCRELDCPLVQISTDYVFGRGDAGQDRAAGGEALGQPKRAPYQEDDPPAPQSVYAKSKLAGEQAAAKFEKHLIVRTCGLYARPSDQRASNFVKTILRLAGPSSELRVVADQRCTPSYVPHVARAILFLAGITNSRPALGESTT